VKNGKKLKLGDAHATPKKYPRDTSIKAWGCPRGTPSSSAKSCHLSKHYIFIVSCTMRFSWGVFTLVFSFV
jgi:hypothetical protein